MNGYFPIILIPNSINLAKKAEYPLPSSPAKPIYKSDNYMLLLPLFVFIIGLFFNFIGSVNKHDKIPCFVIGYGAVLFSIIIFFKFLNDISNTKKRFRESLKEYDVKLKDYSISLENAKKLQKDKSFLKSYRNDKLRNLLKTIKGAQIAYKNTNVGVSENFFFEILQKCFPNCIFKDMIIEKFSTNGFPYQPDIIFCDTITNLHIDIEIDEPYSFNDGKPLHYFENYSVDNHRNQYFTEKQWIVIRFAEEQVVKYPYECCHEIAKTILDIIPDFYFCQNYTNFNNLPVIKCWSLEEAKNMYNSNYRWTYLNKCFIEKEVSLVQNSISNIFEKAKKNYYEKSDQNAIDKFTLIIKTMHSNEQAYYWRGISYKNIHEYKKALNDLYKVCEINPNNSEAYNQIGNIYYINENINNAIKAYSKAVSINSNPIYFENRAKCYQRIDKFENAIEDYSSILLTAKNKHAIYNLRGLLFRYLGYYDRAISDYNSALTLCSNNLTYLRNRAYAKFFKGDFDGASFDFNTVIDIDPTDSFAILNIDLIQSFLFSKNLIFAPANINGRDFISIANSLKNKNMGLFNLLSKNPQIEKWNSMSELWKSYFRNEYGFKGTPNDEQLNQVLSTEILEFNMKGLSDISVVYLLPYLKELQIGWCPVSDLNPIKACLKLKILIISGTKITDLSAISNLKSLEVFHMLDTKIKDIEPLSGLSNLQDLLMQDSIVEDITPLKKLNKLETLNIQNTKVKDLSPLFNHRKLKELNIDFIPINEDKVKEQLKVIIQNNPEIELVHDDNETPSINMYVDGNGGINFDPQDLTELMQDPDKYQSDYERYRQLMKDINSGKVSTDLLGDDSSKRSISMEELELIIRFSKG